ncbi:MAG: lipopolysaccharide transport periplasmic protein LptA [Gammaproteobacteria bacterium]
MLKNQVARMLLLGLCFPLMSIAASPDDTQDLEISSEQFEYREKEGIATYQGHVEAIQGSRRMNGDTLQVYRGKDGGINKIVVYGKPATHESLPDPQKPLFHAQANTITFEINKNKLTLLDHARVEQGGDVYEAPLIEYDVTQKIVRSPESGSGRTTITLKPRE